MSRRNRRHAHQARAGRSAAPRQPGPADLLDRAGQIALLIALDEGPARPGDALAVANALLDEDLPPTEVDTMLADGLAVPLGPPGPDPLLAITTTGRALLDRADQAIEHARRLDRAALRQRVDRLPSADRVLAGLVALGWPDQRIATALHISPRAAEQRVRTVLHRLAMPSRNALIAFIASEADDPGGVRAN